MQVFGILQRCVDGMSNISSGRLFFKISREIGHNAKISTICVLATCKRSITVKVSRRICRTTIGFLQGRTVVEPSRVANITCIYRIFRV